MKQKTIIITSIFIVSAGIQLISQVIVTRLFGASLEMANFLVAVTVPTMLVTVIYATLNDAFLPLYGEKLDSKDKGIKYFSSVVYGLGLISWVVAMAGSLWSVQIVKLLFGQSQSFQLDVASKQLSYMIYCLPLAVIATLLGSWWYAHKHFLRFPVAQLVGTVTNLGIIVLLYPVWGIWALVSAFVINLVFQIAWVWVKVRPRWSWLNIKGILLAWWPLIVGSIAMRSDMLLIRVFGAQLGGGYLVYLNLLAKIFSISASLITVGIQVLLLPHLVEHFSQKKYQSADKLIGKAKLVSLLLSIGVSLSIWWLSPAIIRILFVGGKFNIEDFHKTISLLPVFVLPGVGWGISSVFFQPLLALKKQLAVGVISVVSLIGGWWSTSYFLHQGLGTRSLAIGLSVLLFGAIAGSEIIWQKERRKLLN